jgi:hypothetical protein
LTIDKTSIHDSLRDIGEGIIFYENEPIFFDIENIIVVSTFTPFVDNEKISKYYASIKILEENKFIETTFKIQENLL